MRALQASGPFDEAKTRALATPHAQTMIEMEVQHARIKSEMMQVLTADQKAKLAQFEAKKEARMQEHMQKHMAASARGLTSSLRSLSFPGGERNLQPPSPPGFFKSEKPIVEKAMERADLLYSGLMFAAGMLSVWTALLLTAAFVALAPASRKSAPIAATISSTERHGPTDRRSEQRRLEHHGAEEPTSARSLSEALPARPLPGAPFASC